jgi:hypothetical protein
MGDTLGRVLQDVRKVIVTEAAISPALDASKNTFAWFWFDDEVWMNAALFQTAKGVVKVG